MFVLYKVVSRLKSQLHFLPVLKDSKPHARRAVLTSASDDLIKAFVECAIYKVNGNHKLSTEEKNKLSKYENHLRASVKPKISFKSKLNFNSESRFYNSKAN